MITWFSLVLRISTADFVMALAKSSFCFCVLPGYIETVINGMYLDKSSRIYSLIKTTSKKFIVSLSIRILFHTYILRLVFFCTENFLTFLLNIHQYVQK